MLRRYLGVGPAWIVVTSVALAIGLTIGAIAVDYATTTPQLAVMGAASGAMVGIAQGALMRNRFAMWRVWMVAMPVLWALGWVVTAVAKINVEKQFTVFGASGAIAFGILSALLLLAGLRREQTTTA
jgi:hypothetical protein